MKINNTMTALGLAVALALASGCAQEAVETEAVAYTPPVELPAADPMQTLGETRMGNNDMTAWDTSGDGWLDQNEFGTGFDSRWSTWDADGDGMFSESEFGTASNAWGDAPGGADTNGLFGVWDADDDGLLDSNEFRTGTFSTWDLDDNDMIDNNEYYTGNTWFGW